MTLYKDNSNEPLISIALQKLEHHPKKDILLKFIVGITNNEAKKIMSEIIRDSFKNAEGVITFNEKHNDEDVNRLIDKLSKSRGEVFKIYATFPSDNRVILPFNFYYYAACIMLFATVLIFIALPIIIQDIPPEWMFLTVFLGGVFGASLTGVMAILYTCKEYKYTHEIEKNTDNFLKELECLEDLDTTNYGASSPK